MELSIKVQSRLLLPQTPSFLRSLIILLQQDRPYRLEPSCGLIVGQEDGFHHEPGFLVMFSIDTTTY